MLIYTTLFTFVPAIPSGPLILSFLGVIWALLGESYERVALTDYHIFSALWLGYVLHDGLEVDALSCPESLQHFLGGSGGMSLPCGHVYNSGA